MRGFYISLFLTIGSGSGSAIAALWRSSPWVVLGARFLCSMGAVGASLTSLVMFLEYLPFSHRLGVICVMVGAWSVAESTAATLSIFMSQPSLLIMTGIAPSASLALLLVLGHRRAKRLGRRDIAPIAESARCVEVRLSPGG